MTIAAVLAPPRVVATLVARNRLKLLPEGLPIFGTRTGRHEAAMRGGLTKGLCGELWTRPRLVRAVRAEADDDLAHNT